MSLSQPSLQEDSLRPEETDQLVMFLSCDTLAPHWYILGAGEASAADRALIQEAAQAAVSDMLQGEDVYWNVDFSPARVERTRRLFLAGVKGLSPRGSQFL